MNTSRRARIWAGAVAACAAIAILVLIVVGRASGVPHSAGFGRWIIALALVAFMISAGLLLRPHLRRDRAGKPGQEPTLFGGLFFISIFLFGMPLMEFSQGGSYLGAMMRHITMPLIMTPVFLWPLARRRIAIEPSCAKCGYPMDREVQQLDDPTAKCPECGAYWKLAGMSVTHRIRWHPWLAAVLAVIGITGVLSMVTPFTKSRRVQLAVLPTSALIQEVTAAPRGFTMDEWAVLSKRSLTPEQKVRLAEGLLGHRARRQYLDHEAEGWFEAAVLAGELPPDIVERYFRGMLDVWIDAPDQAATGETISVGIGSEDRSSLRTPTATALRAFVVFAGFGVDDGPLQGALDRAVYSRSFGRVNRSFGKLQRDDAPEPQIDLTTDSPGTRRVRAEYWLILSPVARGWQITYGAAGTPAVPPGTAWCEKVTVEKTITIGTRKGDAR